MSISVVLNTNAVIEYKDSQEEGKFWYQVHPSGALAVFAGKGADADRMEIVYGPSAWRSVQGHSTRTR